MAEKFKESHQEETAEDISEVCRRCLLIQERIADTREKQKSRDDELVRVWQTMDTKVNKWWFTGLVGLLVFALGVVGWGQRSINSLIITQTEKIANQTEKIAHQTEKISEINAYTKYTEHKIKELEEEVKRKKREKDKKDAEKNNTP